jgi:hypothetical protein
VTRRIFGAVNRLGVSPTSEFQMSMYPSVCGCQMRNMPIAINVDAISYAQARARFRAGEIRVLDSIGNVERTIAFNEADRKL